MRITKQRLIAGAALAFLTVMSTLGSLTSAKADSLNEALSQTLARNPSLAAAKSTYEARYMEQFVTLSTMLPRVSAFASQTRSDTDAKNAYTAGLTGTSQVEKPQFDSDSYGIQLTQQLFTSGKNLNAFRAKRADIRAEQAKLLATEQQILLAAIGGYLDVLRTQSVLRLREKNVDVLQGQLDAVKDRFEVGVVTRTDVAQSEAALAGAKAGLLGAQADLRAARAGYKEIIGIEPVDLVKPRRLPRLPRSLDRALSIARKDSPTLKTAQEQAASGRFQSYSTVGGALPSIDLTGTYARTENPSGAPQIDADTTSVQLRLNVPLFMGGQSVAAIIASGDVSNALKQNVHAASNTLEREVIVAWNNVATTKAAAESRRQQIEASTLALEGVRQENRLGTRTNLDVLDAEQSLLDARVGLIEAERNEQLAAYNLLASMGRLTAKRLRIKPADIGSE